MGERKKTHKYGLAADEHDPRYKSSKDTKRWCRGRVGVEHRKAWSDEQDRFRTRYNLPYYEALSCIECGKVFDRQRKQWTIPALIRALRMAQGMTQEELGAKLGMAQNRITVIENGDGDLTLKTIKRFAQAFNVRASISFSDCGDILLNHEQARGFRVRDPLCTKFGDGTRRIKG